MEYQESERGWMMKSIGKKTRSRKIYQKCEGRTVINIYIFSLCRCVVLHISSASASRLLVSDRRRLVDE